MGTLRRWLLPGDFLFAFGPSVHLRTVSVFNGPSLELHAWSEELVFDGPLLFDDDKTRETLPLFDRTVDLCQQLFELAFNFGFVSFPALMNFASPSAITSQREMLPKKLPNTAASPGITITKIIMIPCIVNIPLYV